MISTKIEPATGDDIPAIVALYADDVLGAAREAPGDLAPYRAAWDAIVATGGMTTVYVARIGDEVAGTLQLTVLPGLSHRGAARAQIEAVRVAAARRGEGIGSTLIRWAIEEARRRGCGLVELTSNRQRTDAARFYERLGFQASHVGFKLRLVPEGVGAG